jgi:spectrin alpha
MESRQIHQKIEELFLTFAKKASAFNSWFENASEDLTDPVRVNSLDEIKALREAHAEFQKSLSSAREDFDQLVALDKKIVAYKVSKNPYTWFTIQTLEESWESLMKVIKTRDADLVQEEQRQKENEDLRKLFAKHANEFYSWLVQTRSDLSDGQGTLEAQLEATQAKYAEVLKKKTALKKIEDLGAKMEESLILDNKYTEHTTVGLAQQWDQLEQLGMRMQHNLEQQIQAKNTVGVTEEQLKDYNETFRYFDKDRSGRLDYQELKSCLRSLGYSLAVVEEGQTDPEFDRIVRQLDPNGEGLVSMPDFMAFMISRETTKVESSSDVVQAFKAAAGQKPYITADELRKALAPDQAEYCINRMEPYVDTEGRKVPGAFNYEHFTLNLFAN